MRMIIAKYILLAWTAVSFLNPAPVTVYADDVEKEVRTIEVWVTAYSSTPEETDDTPHLTASGKLVRDGIVAANFLPFDAKIQIPEVFGDKIFVVEDRMHGRKTDFVDVWMPTKAEAKKFGIRRTNIIVLD